MQRLIEFIVRLFGGHPSAVKNQIASIKYEIRELRERAEKGKAGRVSAISVLSQQIAEIDDHLIDLEKIGH